MLLTILYAAAGSAITSAGVYLKKTTPEQFDKIKFLTTVILSAVCALGAGLLGITDNEFATSAVGVFLATTIEPWVKSLFRKESILRSRLK